MKKIIAYIIMFMFLIIPISYAGNCYIEKDSMIAGKATDFILFDFFLQFEEKEFMNFMFKKNYINITLEKINIIKIVSKTVFKKYEVIGVKILSDDNEEVVVWVIENRIKCKEEKKAVKGIRT